MPSRRWPQKLAHAFATLRGAMLVLFAVLIIAVPEKAMPGSSSEPIRSLALVVASRTLLLGSALVVLALRRRLEVLAWVLWADAALQVFDTGLALATDKGAVAILPAILCVLDVWAGAVLRRAARG